MKRMRLFLASLVLGICGLARAQGTLFQPEYWGPNLQLSVGGGIADFSENSARHLTTMGGTWDVRLMYLPYSPVAAEVAYVGTANPLNHVMNVYALGGALLGTQLEGDIRLQTPYVVGTRIPLQPYLFGGVGWCNFELVNQDFRNPVAIGSDANVLVLPYGAGLQAYVTPQFAVDARWTYRAMFDEDMLHVDNHGVAGVSTQGLSQWTLSGRLGYVF